LVICYFRFADLSVPFHTQDEATGTSPLMAAAALGDTASVEALLAAGAPWNALDRRGRCAGDCAMAGDHGDAAGAILEAGEWPYRIGGAFDKASKHSA